MTERAGLDQPKSAKFTVTVEGWPWCQSQQLADICLSLLYPKIDDLEDRTVP